PAGTNLAAVKSPNVDILAHPGLIAPEEAALAAKNDILLELSARGGHCLCNGRVARLGLEAGASLLVNSDTHAPENLLTQELQRMVAEGAGLSNAEVEKALRINPEALLKRVR
ncbi:MAG: histidinol phosphate phosphatase domain-containing protein, partial [Armatimonadetes bacterium]|nr:histidinol phosphate phosphatase domain-containing protein [Armatimonadota bacterium]NIM22756.1 histidinol phosphate phosphatase domain-containing protein [Armatimonadota bacterium]NIM66581.1 histidinol phosphate phosphatase domain-containing protein [Armatimonadota bacterium]NIM75182.1 histidinol phosphate phosphatase domain-containing protein [Armatimonadota bacterium]NIN04806.1 histidinol phosphate phosphatase domain-containing protein [Armatimonadota bacterium]